MFCGLSPGWVCAPLMVSTLAWVGAGVILPSSPLAGVLGFEALPAAFMAVLVAMIVVHLMLIELGKRRFYRALPAGPLLARPHPPRQRRIGRRASWWTVVTRPPRRRLRSG